MPDGEVINLNAEQAIQAAQYGLIRMKEAREKKPEKKDEVVVEEEDEIVSLRKELSDLKRGLKHKEDVDEVNSILYNLTQSHKETKENPKLGKKISDLTLARVNINPSLSFNKVFKQELEDYLDMIPKPKTEEETATNAVRRSMINTIRGGSTPIVESEQKFTAKDVRTGKSRKALQEWVERAQAENR